MARRIRFVPKSGASGRLLKLATRQQSPKLASAQEASGCVETPISRKPDALRQGVAIAPPQARRLKLLTVREAVEFAKVSTQTVRRWIKFGYIKTYHAGRQIRIYELDLIHYLSPQCMV
jgi:excisionase family DNA binding protein